ncbi:Zein-binding domain [Macleaya cordata]|uniref:Zein-binding domain n=1 Tax=Macleaya cordata TaxID=56857 RepID=A0A200Q4A0_MACCD|nr:Zein-binding domain [Macleaya cordata]
MDTRTTPSVKVQKDSRGFPAVLASAVHEWLLIFLLFVNAVFSYFVTKFARSSKLQTPCLLCSRLDHVLGNEKPGFYEGLICDAHKLEISSLVYCRIHDKLADVHDMCEVCLFSFATEKKPTPETNRLLLGKLGNDLGSYLYQDPLLTHTSSEKQCSCCNETWTSRLYDQRLLQAKPIASESSVGHSRVNHRDGLKKRNKKRSGQLKLSYLRNRSFEALSHIGYSELKITSESESEIPFSDEDDASTLAQDGDDFKEEFVAQCVQSESGTTTPLLKTPEDVATEKLISQTTSPVLPVLVPNEPIDVGEPDYLTPVLSVQAASPVLSVVVPNEQIDVGEPDYLTPVQAASPVLSVLVPNEQIDLGEPDYLTPLASSGAIGHGLEELNWHQDEQQADRPAPPELISLDDVPSSFKTAEAFAEASGETLDTVGTGDLNQSVMTETEKVCKLETVSVATTGSCLEMDEVVGVSGETSVDAAVTGKTRQTSPTESGEIHKLESGLTTTSGPGLKTDQGLNDGGPPIPNLVDQTDSLKLFVGNKGSQVSSMFAEQLTPKGSTRVNEDLKLLLSQAARGLESSSNDMSPRAYFQGEDLKNFDSSSSSGMPKRITIERNESGVESLDGSIVSEIEGESVVDRLKRQVEHDRKSMSALYKELEEERNASAIAANQAMAMITRLQEEKASLHMEALQYLRMMEEQAEYDVEALQKANDLLAEREKEMQDLEAELEMYRQKFPDELMVDEIQDSWCDLNGGDVQVDSDLSCSNLPYNSLLSNKSEGTKKFEKLDTGFGDNYMSIVKDSLSEFEDERLYITQCLKKLEKQLHLFSKNGVQVNTSNGGYSGKECHGVNDQEQHHCDEATQHNGQLENDESSSQKDSSLCREDLSVKGSCTSPVGNHQLLSKENHHSDSDAQEDSADRGTNLVALENEVSDLNERLEALEADRSFLEHTINALQNGDEGIQFVQEIAHHLRELRRIGIKRIEQTVT